FAVHGNLEELRALAGSWDGDVAEAPPMLQLLRFEKREIVLVEIKGHDPFMVRLVPEHFGIAVASDNVRQNGVMFGFLPGASAVRAESQALGEGLLGGRAAGASGRG